MNGNAAGKYNIPPSFFYSYSLLILLQQRPKAYGDGLRFGSLINKLSKRGVIDRRNSRNVFLLRLTHTLLAWKDLQREANVRADLLLSLVVVRGRKGSLPIPAGQARPPRTA